MTDRAFLMNVGDFALTEYQNYTFNSFVFFDGSYWGAGPDGIYKLTGTTDDGSNIAWSFRTGMLDGKKQGLKRLEEILLSMRFNGPVTLRVWVDDDLWYDYNLANYREDVLHVVRAKLGRGLRSKYFRVEVSGVDNTVAEVSSIDVPMIPLKRRIG